VLAKAARLNARLNARLDARLDAPPFAVL